MSCRLIFLVTRVPPPWFRSQLKTAEIVGFKRAPHHCLKLKTVVVVVVDRRGLARNPVPSHRCRLQELAAKNADDSIAQ